MFINWILKKPDGDEEEDSCGGKHQNSCQKEQGEINTDDD